MNLIVIAVLLALIVGAVDYFIGLKDDVRKVAIAGVVILLIVGIILLFWPGFPRV